MRPNRKLVSSVMTRTVCQTTGAPETSSPTCHAKSAARAAGSAQRSARPPRIAARATIGTQAEARSRPSSGASGLPGPASGAAAGTAADAVRADAVREAGGGVTSEGLIGGGGAGRAR